MARKISSKLVSLTFGILVLLFAIGFYIFAWTEPTQAPPGGNVPAPINVGSTAQTKAGALTVTTLTTSAGKLYLDDTTEGDIERVNAVIGYNDLFLKSNSAENASVYIAGSLLRFYSGGTERWRIDSNGTLTIGSVPWPRLTSFPLACPAGQYVTAVGSSLTCSTPPGGIANAFAKIANDAGTVQFSASGEDTLRLAAGSGLSIVYDSSTKKVTYSHYDTSAQSSVDNSGGTVIQDVTLDTYGHVTSLGSTNLDTRYVSRTDWTTHDNYPPACSSGQFVTGIGDTLTCASPPAGGGDITGVIAGSGLTGGGLSGDVTLNVGAGTGISVGADSIWLTYPSFACSAGYSLREINLGTGGYVCEYDDVGAGGGIGGTISAGQVAFGTADNTIGGDNNLWWDNTNKRLGIGTTAPSQKLDVIGYVRGSTGLCIGNDCRTSWPAGGGLSGSGTTNYIAKWTGSTSLGNSQIYDNGTNVGIGTIPPPKVKLYSYRPYGDYGAGKASVYGYRYGIYGEANGGTSWSESGVDAAVKGFSYYGNQYTAGVAGYNYNDYANSAGVIGADSISGYWGALGFKDGNSLTWGVYTPNNAYFGGNVGIGTTAPTQKLDVIGYVRGSTGLCIGNDCRTSWPAGGGLSGSGTTNYIAKWTGSTSLGNSQIYDNGTNVGIGTISPGKKLDVSGDINYTGGIYKSGTRGLPSEDLRPTIVSAQRSTLTNCEDLGTTVLSATITVGRSSKILIFSSFEHRYLNPFYAGLFWLERGTTPITAQYLVEGSAWRPGAITTVDSVSAGTYTYYLRCGAEHFRDLEIGSADLVVIAFGT